jgi:hypothetical protein
LFKIAAKVQTKVERDSYDELVTNFRQSVVFNESENILYKRYESDIKAILIRLDGIDYSGSADPPDYQVSQWNFGGSSKTGSQHLQMVEATVDPGYNYPVLQENDFLLFLTALKAPGLNAKAFSKKHKTTEEHITSVIVKITANTLAKVEGVSDDELIKDFNQTILFNESESSLYKKYEEDILKNLYARTL